jgi:leucyl aminopeptidase (aminopeptidase T)
MDALIIDASRSADLIIRRLLAVKPGEQVAIVCDPHSEMGMAYALAGAVESVGAEYTILIMPTRGTQRKNDLTPVIEQGLRAADCLIGLTGASGAPTYSSAVKELYNQERLRTISMVMRDMENFTSGGALADYEQLFEEGQQLAEIWEKAAHIHVTSPAGTDLRASIAGEKVIVECGFATEPGLEAAFSDGEVSQMPRVNTAEGLVVVDGPIAHIGQLSSPITLRVQGGRIVSVEGDSRQAQELRHIVETIPQAANIAEIGIGLNPMSRRNGDFEEEKKARGNVHIALGDNVFYGGDVHSPVHMDMVIYNPTVRLDGRKVVERGQVYIENQSEEGD